MKSERYWQERFEALEKSQMATADKYLSELERQYRKASVSIQKETEHWFNKFANNNQISLTEARKWLTGKDLEEFNWSVQDYIEKGRTLNYTKQWEKQLINTSSKVHVTRLEAIQLQMRQHIEELYGRESKDVDELLSKIYEDGYYHTAYEIQKGTGIGYSLMKLDKDQIEKIIKTPWASDGSNFSDRIWTSKAKLVSELQTGLTQALIQGKSSYSITEDIAKKFNVSMRQASRLVQTESAFICSASTRDCYKELGVEEFEVLATLDNKTSEICQGMDGKHFPMSQYEIGVTAPPFHPNCRSTTVPYFNDEFTADETRAYRDIKGKTQKIDASMKYPEWKKKFLDTDSEDVILTDRETRAYTNPRVNEFFYLDIAILSYTVIDCQSLHFLRLFFHINHRVRQSKYCIGNVRSIANNASAYPTSCNRIAPFDSISKSCLNLVKHVSVSIVKQPDCFIPIFRSSKVLSLSFRTTFVSKDIIILSGTHCAKHLSNARKIFIDYIFLCHLIPPQSKIAFFFSISYQWYKCK